MSEENTDNLDTNNHGVIGLMGDKIIIRNPPGHLMHKDDALVFAAWIVTLADPTGERFQQVLDAVQNS